MSISVDKVYKTALVIFNTKHSGKIPIQQFDRVARLAQLDMLEQTVYEYNYFLVREEAGLVKNEHADIAKNIREKIDSFAKTNPTFSLTSGVGTIPTDLYRVSGLYTNGRATSIDEVKKNELPYLLGSQLNQPSTTYPVYYTHSGSIYVYPTTITSCILDYIKMPADPKWGYTVGTVGQYEYDEDTSVDFELHPSEEVDLIINILSYFGIIIKDPEIVQEASMVAATKSQQEKI